MITLFISVAGLMMDTRVITACETLVGVEARMDLVRAATEGV